MASYVEPADFGVFGIGNGALDAIADATKTRHGEAASRKFDSYVSGRGWPTPLTTVGDDIKQSICQVAAYEMLVSLRGVNPENPGHMALLKAHDDAIAWWRDIARGIANPDVVATTPGRAATRIATFTSNPKRC